jgi:type II secretory pathway pseudopilin PulG
MNMRKPDMTRNDAGSTMIELIIAAVVFTTGMVAVLGGMTSMQTQNRYSEDRARAVNYSMSQMEALRGLSVTGLLNYVVPYDNVQAQTVNIPGSGPCTVALFAVIPGAGDAAPTYLQLGSSAAAAYPSASVPNPVEVQAVVTPSGPGVQASFKVTTKIVF